MARDAAKNWSLSGNREWERAGSAPLASANIGNIRLNTAAVALCRPAADPARGWLRT